MWNASLTSQIRSFGIFFLAAVLFMVAVGCGDGEEDDKELAENLPAATAESAALTASGITITISPNLPSDIPVTLQTNLQDAAVFAWQEFIALNWPASGVSRDTPDMGRKFGDPEYNGQAGEPLVWETFRSKVEIYPGGTDTVPPGCTNVTATGCGNRPDYGYDAVPVYTYNSKVDACSGQTPLQYPAWINLDETNQIGLDNMFAGVLPHNSSPINTNPNLIRFLAKANRQEYTYVAGNHYWDKGNDYNTRVSNFLNAINASPPRIPTSPIISFPDGTIEMKAAWRPLTAQEQSNPELAGRFHTATVRYYDQKQGGSFPQPCYREDTWALIALHIIHKTPTAPYFIYATFEQADNIRTQDGHSVEDVNGRIVFPQAGPFEPTLSYTDSPTDPQVTIVGSNYCQSIGSRLYYKNIGGPGTGLPNEGNICVNQRQYAIPDPVIAVNEAAHSAINAYNQANRIPSSPWEYYKLVNVQWKPIEKNGPDYNALKSTFYLANIVVETNFSLQNFSGRLTAGGDGVATNYPPGGSQPDFKNVVTFDNGSVQKFNMGGCMACHGTAQVDTQRGGNDFSFILQKGKVPAPEFPEIN